MASHEPTFRSPRAIAIIEKILAAIPEDGEVSTNNLVAAAGRSMSLGTRYVQHMHSIGLIVRTRKATGAFYRPGMTWGGALPAMWARIPQLSTGPAVEPDAYPRRVVVRRTWSASPARCEFECLLFGAKTGEVRA